MKKLLTSALITGLLLGSVSPVFAVEGVTKSIDGTEETDPNQTGSTSVNSEVAAEYTVLIPEQLNINLMGDEPEKSAKGEVKLTKLTADGYILVTAQAADLTTGKDELKYSNKTLTTEISSGNEFGESAIFELRNGDIASDTTKEIIVKTNEESKNNLPGEYTGSITFTFNYVQAEAVADVEL